MWATGRLATAPMMPANSPNGPSSSNSPGLTSPSITISLLAGTRRSIDFARTRSTGSPANSEIVIEGEVRPGELEDEGPFGEFAGIMGAVAKRPVAHITAITYRTRPLFYGYTSQMPPSESTTIQSLMNAGVVLHMMRDHIGDDAVQDVWIDQTFGGLFAHAILSIAPAGPRPREKVGRTVADIA